MRAGTETRPYFTIATFCDIIVLSIIRGDIMKKTVSLLLAFVMLFSTITECGIFVFAKGSLLVDNAGLMSYNECDYLKDIQKRISKELKFDIVVVTTNSIGSKTPMVYADDYYDNNGYGYGSNHDGCLMLINMSGRDWYISTCGYGIHAITDYGLTYISNQFVGDLSNGKYYDAFYKYVMLVRKFVIQARTSKPYDLNNIPQNIKLSVTHPKNIRLKKERYVFNGKAVTPKCIVCDNKGNILPNSQYTVSMPKDRKNIGKHMVTVNIKGKKNKTRLYFYIIPKTPTIIKVNGGKGEARINWRKIKGVSGYQIQCATDKKFTKGKKTVKAGAKATTKRVAKLKANKVYYVRIRSYKIVNKKPVYSKWSAVKSAKTTK